MGNSIHKFFNDHAYKNGYGNWWGHWKHSQEVMLHCFSLAFHYLMRGHVKHFFLLLLCCLVLIVHGVLPGIKSLETFSSDKIKILAVTWPLHTRLGDPLYLRTLALQAFM